MRGDSVHANEVPGLARAVEHTMKEVESIASPTVRSERVRCVAGMPDEEEGKNGAEGIMTPASVGDMAEATHDQTDASDEGASTS